MHRDHPRLEKTELFERLARGLAARVTVVTPNRRLGHALQSEFVAFQVARGLKAWETADVLPLDAFVQRLWDDALYSDLGAGVPVLLSPAQEQALWEEAIRATRHAEALFSTAPAAAQCRQAWRLAHEWRLPLDAAHAPNEDARAFLDWSQRYTRATRENAQTDAARLPDAVAAHLAHPALRKPSTIVLFGFDIVTPRTREFLDALASHGSAVMEAESPARRASVTRVELSDAKAEIAAAARWARSRLEAAAPSSPAGGKGYARRIGVVVPDLASSRARVQRAFANVLRPDHLVVPGEAALPFNISLGSSLDAYPLVADALLVIDLAGPEVPFEEASRVIRSPFLAGAQAEMEARARLDARLRKGCAPSIALDALVALCGSSRSPRVPILVDRLSRLADFRKAGLFGVKPASEWARGFSEALRIAGFPGERSLDSREHQALERWHELLGEFATLERVTGRMGFFAARERLRSMAREAIFQPEAREVPIQVMGILESAGQEFDHLWVMGLTDAAWPLPAHPNPFIPVNVQRAAGIPQADPVSSLELDRRITQGWLHCADEVVLSHPRMKDESELAPSPLIASIVASPVEALALERYATLREAIRASGVVQTVQDGEAPRVAPAEVQAGGTGLFKDQAACPFRAFAARRLDAKALETPRPGLDARDRGNIVHAMLARVWESLRSRDELIAASDARLLEILGGCADGAIAEMKRKRADTLAGPYAVLERDRLVRLARDWLDVERARDGFEVVAIEKKRPVTFGGITVEAKLDRMDKLDRGGHAVIDYKTGACKTSAWMGRRPDEPQLPMYALGGGEDVAVVAFAVVRTGESRFKGVSRVAALIPKVPVIEKDPSGKKHYRDWGELAAGWQVELDAIGRGFAQGDARVDPKRGAATCANCEQAILCRIAEKAPFGAGTDEGEGDADE